MGLTFATGIPETILPPPRAPQSNSPEETPPCPVRPAGPGMLATR